MITETKEIYKCSHCRKLYQIKTACINHEKGCHKSPYNERVCFNCPFLDKKFTTIHYDTGYGEDERSIELLHCSKIDSFLYPPKVEHKGNMFELGDESNQPMKSTCEHYDQEMKSYNIDFLDFVSKNNDPF